MGRKDASLFSLQLSTQRSGKIKFLCKAHKKVMLELEWIVFVTLCVRHAIVFLLTISSKEKTVLKTSGGSAEDTLVFQDSKI